MLMIQFSCQSVITVFHSYALIGAKWSHLENICMVVQQQQTTAASEQCNSVRVTQDVQELDVM